MRRKPARADVLVVGSGPVGLFAALRLADLGIGVSILDQSAQDERSTAVILHPATLRLLDDMGILPELVAAGQRITAVDAYQASGEQGTIDLATVPGGPPFALAVEGHLLTQLLEERLADKGVAVRWSHRLAGFEPADGVVRAEIERLEEVSTGYAISHREWEIAESHLLDAGFIVGADGAHSLVRRRLGLPVVNLGDHRFAVFEGPGDVGDRQRVGLHADGSALLWPLPGDRWRWVFELDGGSAAARPIPHRDELVPELGGWEVAARAREDLQIFLQRRAPWFRRRLEPDVALELWTPRQRLASHGVGRVWVIGDAAHLDGPLAGDSLNLGLCEAVELTSAIARIVRGEGGLELLAGYDDERLRAWSARASAGERDGGSETWVTPHRAALAACLPVGGGAIEALLG